MQLTENFKAVPGYEGFYEVSDQGRVKSLSRIVASAISRSGCKTTSERIVKPHLTRGYPYVALCKNGKPKSLKIHRLVLAAFEGEQPDKDVNHKDGNKENNHLSNLEYCSHKANMAHAYALGNYRRNIVQCSLTGKVYESIKHAAEVLGIKRETLSQQLHGRRSNSTTLKIIRYATH